jgi:predicted ribosome quality control (RQC) complex YloA/Tae2 family protein
MVKFRELISKKGTLILAGRNAENNEELIGQVNPNEEVFHTASPGSPFVNIKGNPASEDIKEAAIFCAKYSQSYRDSKGDVVVHRFKGKDVYKRKGMEKGTFGVKKLKKMNIKKKWIEDFKNADS